MFPINYAFGSFLTFIHENGFMPGLITGINVSDLIVCIILIVAISAGAVLLFVYSKSLPTKIATAIVAVVACFVLMASYSLLQVYYSQLISETETTRQLKVELVTQKLETTSRLMSEQVQSSMRVLKNEGSANGAPPSLGATVQVGDKTVPNLILGGVSQANDFAIVDRVKDLMGGTATLFVKSGEDFVRISTNVQKDDGKRAVGTILDPKGKAISEVKQGKSFYGVVYILERPYITGYEPIKDATGNTIGVWYVGYQVSALEELGRTIANAAILDKGFFALQDDKGKIVFKSQTASDDILQKISTTDISPEITDWNVKKEVFPAWGYTILSGYSKDDPQLTAKISLEQFRIVVGALVFLVMLAILTIFMMRRFMNPLGEAVKAANQLAEGNVEVEINVKSRDEIGQLQFAMREMVVYLKEVSQIADEIAGGNLNVKISPRSEGDHFGHAFKNMLDRTLRLVQSQDERNDLQRSMMKLLDEVAEVAKGDLTVQAEVTEDVTGAIADAFNYMIDELRGIIGRVQTTTKEVDASASQMRFVAKDLARSAETQVVRLTDISETVEQMTTSMQRVSQDVGLSVQVAEQSLTNAKNGNIAVRNNIAAMGKIRSQVQETAERMKRLGERSQEISSIVKIINDIAQRTNILALNASIQANAAGAQGRGFVVVAEEVEKLAERSSNASKQIDVLTKAIQGETDEAYSSMEATMREVLTGAKLTNEVGLSLSEIEIVSVKLADLSRQVSVAAKRQASGSEVVANAMREIVGESQNTAAEMKNSTTVVARLANSVNELQASVASFRIPDHDGNDTSFDAGTNFLEESETQKLDINKALNVGNTSLNGYTSQQVRIG
ncbi:MAG: Cache 3/Cache 2 fusion domain-containing protein [Pyrinomonadaceae bacterium]|nr:Cache 3/Cache 2 fusion domain-containing protein [Pyrinomonadaceae bacterium]